MSKIFFVSKDASWQKYRNDILKAFSIKYNSEIKILTVNGIKDYLSKGEKLEYKHFFNFCPPRNKLSFFPGAVKYIVKNKPDVVLALNNSTQVTEYCALIMCRLLRIKFVWWTHGYDHYPVIKSKLMEFIKKKYSLFFLNLGNQIITFSDEGRDYLINQKISPEKITTAPNTLDTKRLLELKEKILAKYSIGSIKKELGVKEQDRIVLFSGRLNKLKRVEDAIKSIRIVSDQINNIKFVIIGTGSEDKNLRKLCEDLIPSKFIFVGELFDEELLSKWFTVADIFLMPGYVGLAIVHAFCFGLPIITEKDAFHGPEIQFLEDNINGYMVRKGDIEALAEKTIYLLNNNEAKEKMSKEALSVISGNASIDNMLRQMKKALL